MPVIVYSSVKGESKSKPPPFHQYISAYAKPFSARFRPLIGNSTHVYQVWKRKTGLSCQRKKY